MRTLSSTCPLGVTTPHPSRLSACDSDTSLCYRSHQDHQMLMLCMDWTCMTEAEHLLVCEQVPAVEPQSRGRPIAAAQSYLNQLAPSQLFFSATHGANLSDLSATKSACFTLHTAPARLEKPASQPTYVSRPIVVCSQTRNTNTSSKHPASQPVKQPSDYCRVEWLLNNSHIYRT